MTLSDSEHTRSERTRILFVCLGNICRSPLAEGVFRHLVRVEGLEDRYHIDSAGTGGWHVGDPPDPRSVEVAARHGLHLEGSARTVHTSDYEQFDLVIAMDRQNLRDLEGRDPGGSAELRLLREFDPEAEDDMDVPDPYYGGDAGFERVYRMVERSCRQLLDHTEGR
jgi:protein-tyrosine phosphatase